VRPAYSFGPSFCLNVFSRQGGPLMVSRIRAGLPLIVPGDGTTLFHAGSARNTGNMIAEMTGAGAAIGKTYTLSHQHVITHEEYYRMFGRALGIEPTIVHIPSDLLIPMELKVIPDNLLSELTRFDLFFSPERLLADFPAFSYEWSLDDAVEDYIRYHDTRLDWPVAGPTYEDRIATAWDGCIQEFRP
jgi:nucleoside-diphosphate-sugar epimerase